MLKILFIFILSSSLYSKECKFYYHIGKISYLYDISKYDLKDILKEVEKEWEDEVGVDFLEYSDFKKKSVPINLINNSKTKNYEQLHKIIENRNFVRDSLLEKFEYLELRKEALNKENKRVNILIENFNKIAKSGKMSKSSFDSKSKILKRESSDLKILKDEYNKISDRYNYDLKIFNNHKDDTKIFMKKAGIDSHEKRGITKILTENKTTRNFYGKVIKVEKVSKATSIEIYRLTTIEDLKIVLAHEIGHMFGLSHTNDKKALMYYTINSYQKNKMNVSYDDVIKTLETLAKKCN